MSTDTNQPNEDTSFEALDDVFSVPMTDAEIRHLETGGTAELEYEDSSATQPADPPAPEVRGDPDQPEPRESDDDLELGEIELEEDGKVRDAKTGRYVPHQALHKERERRKEAETKLRDEETARARIQGRIDAFNEAIASRQSPTPEEADAPAEEPIDPDEDIFGAFRQQQQVIQKLQERLESTDTRTQEHQQFTQTQNAYIQDATKFSQETPDFPDAYGYVKENMHKELELQGVTDAAEREQFIRSEELKLVQGALQQGRSPSELIYALAQQRGYAKPAAEDTADPATPELPTGESAPAPKGKLDGVAEGQQVAATLHGKGSGGDPGLTYETLANMSEDEMYAFSKKSPAAFKKMMQGL